MLLVWYEGREAAFGLAMQGQIMATFSATDAGLVGFKLAREHPAVVPIWAALTLLNSLLTSFVMISLAGPALAEIGNASPAATDPAAMGALYAQMAPAYLVIILVSFAFSGILNAAAVRIVLHPADRATGFVRLGPDEFRQMLLALLITLIMLGVGLVGALGVGALAGALAAVALPLASLGGVLGVVAILGLFIYLSVRLSLASTITFETRKIAIRASWDMTRGHFWNLFGAYLLAGVMGAIVAILGTALIFVVMALVFGFGTAGTAITNPDMSSFGAYMTPAVVVYTLGMSVFSALAYLIFLCAAPTIYGQMKGDIDIFD
jgi:hypothetical protein